MSTHHGGVVEHEGGLVVVSKHEKEAVLEGRESVEELCLCQVEWARRFSLIAKPQLNLKQANKCHTKRSSSIIIPRGVS